MTDRYSRNEALFGTAGQDKIRATKVAVVGIGGLGSHLVQQLAYLGTAVYGLVDPDIVTDSSLNRLIGAFDSDVQGQTPKVDVGKRLITAVSPRAIVDTAKAGVADAACLEIIRRADVVFGCLDRDLPRLQLIDLCAQFGHPLIDLATDVEGQGNEARYGGRIVVCDGDRCLVCLNLLDQDEITRDSMSPTQREAHQEIYGIPTDALGGTGPMVVSINGAVASLAITEYMALVTGLRPPIPNLRYFAERQQIRRSTDIPSPGCYYCALMRSNDGNRLSPPT